MGFDNHDTKCGISIFNKEIDMIYPLDINKYKITARYNDRNTALWGNNIHGALDIAAKEGTPIQAIADGVVIVSTTNNDGSKTVKIRHDDMAVSVYHHNSQNLVYVGDKVREGMTIALVGKTGKATGPHVHFAIESYNPYRTYDPEIYIKQNIDKKINMENTITVQPGWGLYNVAKAAGFPDYAEENRWTAIAQLNGAKTWHELNLFAGMVIQVRTNNDQGTIIAKQEVEISMLDAKINALQDELQNKEGLISTLNNNKKELEMVIGNYTTDIRDKNLIIDGLNMTIQDDTNIIRDLREQLRLAKEQPQSVSISLSTLKLKLLKDWETKFITRWGKQNWVKQYILPNIGYVTVLIPIAIEVLNKTNIPDYTIGGTLIGGAIIKSLIIGWLKDKQKRLELQNK